MPSIDERLEALVHTMELFQGEMNQMKEAIYGLVQIAHSHENRLDDLET